MDCDIVIIGAGPAGLAFASTVAGSGLSVCLIDRQSYDDIADPKYDGREIALTHHSQSLLHDLGAWDLLPDEAIAPLRKARVLNGNSSFALNFDTGQTGADALGALVCNHEIRRALFRCAQKQQNVELLTGASVVSIERSSSDVVVKLADGRAITAKLLVGADSRFSWVREQLGIAAEINRLGRGMLVARMQHAKPHDAVATEWFDHHQTMAMLPLQGNNSSAVITLPMGQAESLMQLGEAAFNAEVTRRYKGRLGQMELVGTRHLYPLATTWSHHFAADRAALIGDASVGMHPVTAHGFNLGLSGQDLLAKAVLDAARKGQDIAGRRVLTAYETAHRRDSAPLYRGTNALVRLFTHEAPSSRVIRHVALRVAHKMPLVQSTIRARLMAR
ncbi:5-demethoxyubiquinol-8 5-hydroxylase UbiM [Altererythrobacter indicus]|uniref:5-demethoxyubiquinol-8 5-hydroxylase UbiM n=1 Tax=Altericroceibacterium indicum TaxID=374177 RepID=A0A845A731_9SPHN|nr:5-demethoxyubiquinol-8 5-hydroxylase UbiM [Altericroceibacterium indicum]MXP26182.1 5-demethoxyubiquinol-8 5-hydroxylase UbiM [Altericroceibacterium indicum]